MIVKPPRVLAKWLGRLSYQDGLTLQKLHLAQHFRQLSPCPNVLLMLEHSPVYTVGLRSGFYSGDEEQRLKALGADFHRTDRGGLITFHGPGQLVVYPMLDLGSFQKAGQIRWYVSRIEDTVITLCGGFGLECGATEDTGVWTGGERDRKLAAIGVHVKERRLTSHGLALNVCPDLWWFDQIVPCGIRGKFVTSLEKELGRKMDLVDVLEPFCRAFSHVFDCPVDFVNEKVEEILG